jgi:hypothetical protein
MSCGSDNILWNLPHIPYECEEYPAKYCKDRKKSTGLSRSRGALLKKPTKHYHNTITGSPPGKQIFIYF